MNQFWEKLWTDWQTDGRTLIHRTIPQAVVQKLRVLANTKQKTKSISQYQTNEKWISEKKKAELKKSKKYFFQTLEFFFFNF